MEDKGKVEARRWLSRQLAWEANLDRLVQSWEKEQSPRRHRSAPKRLPAFSRHRRKSGLPLEKPAA
jgi:hypothetical protein